MYIYILSKSIISQYLLYKIQVFFQVKQPFRCCFFSVSWNWQLRNCHLLGFHTATPRVRCVLWQWHKSPSSMAVWWPSMQQPAGHHGCGPSKDASYTSMSLILQEYLTPPTLKTNGFWYICISPRNHCKSVKVDFCLDPWHLQHPCFFKLPNPPDWVELREQKNPPQRRCVGLVETDGFYRSDFPCPRFLVDILQDVQCEHCVSKEPLMSIYAVLAYVFQNLWLLNKKFGINSNLFPTVPHLLRHCQSILFGPFQHTLQWNTKRLHDSPKNTRGSNGWFKRWGEKITIHWHPKNSCNIWEDINDLVIRFNVDF